jgi:urease accessory protein
MDIYSRIIGHADAPEIAGELHRLEHAGALDEVVLAHADLARRRMRAVTAKGTGIGIALARDTKLCDGAVLRLDPDAALIVRVEAERWLRLRPADTPAALRLGYHAGNLHWRVRFDGHDVLVGLEGSAERYLDRLCDLKAEGAVRVIGEEAGA